ncbi:MAG: succinate dehydrogenase [Gemmatimonadetes bacterium]|nr:succinate dehydrogenase [Gemmatimonadota bacterium]
MTHAQLPIQRRFGETLRRDAWWLPPLTVLAAFSAFLIYGTWSALTSGGYTFGPYFSPFHAPELWGPTEHAWFGPQPAWWPSFLFFPALLVLPFPGLFRFSCYYYRGAYYKGFWADPPACAVGEPRTTYRGERPFPNWLQNLHRYTMYVAVAFIGLLAIDAWKAFWFLDNGVENFGIGVGSLVMTANVTVTAAYTFGCHSLRHVIGGFKDRLSGQPVRAACYAGCSKLNERHGLYAKTSMGTMIFTDIYIRLCASGVITDWRIF